MGELTPGPQKPFTIRGMILQAGLGGVDPMGLEVLKSMGVEEPFTKWDFDVPFLGDL